MAFVWVMLQTKKVNKFAVTPTGGPPTVWIELMRQYEDVQLGKCLIADKSGQESAFVSISIHFFVIFFRF